MHHPYSILDRKRAGGSLSEEHVREIVAGVVDGSWSDAQLAAFLMAAATRGLNREETQALTRGMLESGAQWNLRRDYPTLVDKHSTGGVGDKVSLVLSPLLAACGLPVVMLTGRGLGHTGGTADKLETIPGFELRMTRERCCALLDQCGVAVGIATDEIAPADRKLYALRDQTGTVVSAPLITASILSKKLATGAAAIVFDVKTGSGAFLRDEDAARDLARTLVDTAESLGVRSSALVTDMSQPLGRWVGHSCEVEESVRCLEGEGEEDLMAVVLALAEELSKLVERPVERQELRRAITSGRARERLSKWVEAQGGDPSSLDRPSQLAPETVEVTAPLSGYLAGVDARRLGLLLVRAGGGRLRSDDAIDYGVALERLTRVGDQVELGQTMARVHLRRRDHPLERDFQACFSVTAEKPVVEPLLRQRIAI